jgi:hypothetical protein
VFGLFRFTGPYLDSQPAPVELAALQWLRSFFASTQSNRNVVPGFLQILVAKVFAHSVDRLLRLRLCIPPSGHSLRTHERVVVNHVHNERAQNGLPRAAAATATATATTVAKSPNACLAEEGCPEVEAVEPVASSPEVTELFEARNPSKFKLSSEGIIGRK